MTDPRAIVFDFDGVLADSEPLHLAATQEACASVGVSITREEYYADYIGFDDRGMFRAIAATHRRHWDDAAIAALTEEKARVFDDAIARTDVLYRGAAACVERMAAAYPLGIASGALKHEIVAILHSAGLARHFRFIVSAEDTPRSKPAPDPYARAAALHGLPPSHCVAIEDSRWGIESAKAAGLLCVGITHTYPAVELRGADAVIVSLDDLTSEYTAKLFSQ